MNKLVGEFKMTLKVKFCGLKSTQYKHINIKKKKKNSNCVMSTIDGGWKSLGSRTLAEVNLRNNPYWDQPSRMCW